MSVVGRSVNVGPVAVRLADLASTSGGSNVVLLNSDAAFAVMVGGPDVTSTTGFPLKFGAALSVTLTYSDQIWAVAGGTTNTVVVAVFRSGG